MRPRSRPGRRKHRSLPSGRPCKRPDIAYANARKEANAKRQQATDAKNSAGEPGANELKQAEANLPDAVKALTDATKAKPPRGQGVGPTPRLPRRPCSKLYDAAEKAAKAAEVVAKAAFEAAGKLDDEAKKATAQASAKRRAADTAKAALERAPPRRAESAETGRGRGQEADRCGGCEEGGRRRLGRRQEPTTSSPAESAEAGQRRGAETGPGGGAEEADRHRPGETSRTR